MRQMEALVVLSKEDSLAVLRSLCSVLNMDRESRIQKYLATKPLRLLGGFIVWDSCSGIGTLWYPKREGERHVGEVWEANLQLDQVKLARSGREVEFTEAVARAMRKTGVIELYGVGEWTDMGPGRSAAVNIGHRAVSLGTDELPDVIGVQLACEGYFFPRDLGCLYCVTHENVLVAAGSPELVSALKGEFPDWREFLFDGDMSVPAA